MIYYFDKLMIIECIYYLLEVDTIIIVFLQQYIYGPKEDKDDAVVDAIAVESTKELEAELLGETNEKNEQKEDQVQSGGSSPTSPAFEVETAPAPQPVDPKEVLTELGKCIIYSIQFQMI